MRLFPSRCARERAAHTACSHSCTVLVCSRLFFRHTPLSDFAPWTWEPLVAQRVRAMPTSPQITTLATRARERGVRACHAFVTRCFWCDHFLRLPKFWSSSLCACFLRAAPRVACAHTQQRSRVQTSAVIRQVLHFVCCAHIYLLARAQPRLTRSLPHVCVRRSGHHSRYCSGIFVQQTGHSAV
jgi:hypothetical protein